MPLTAKKKNNKRKRRDSNDEEEEVDEVQLQPKTAGVDQLETATNLRSPWHNLDLILSLQDKTIELTTKVNLAFDYVNSSTVRDMEGIRQRSQVLDTSRTIAFLNNWVQSVLFSCEKKMRHEGYIPQPETSGSLLDIRCWKILHFCLEESKNLRIPLTCSRDFLRVVHCIAMDASSCVKDFSLCSEETLSGDRLQLYDVVLDCISLVFSFHGGVADENLNLWILLVDKVLEIILIIVGSRLDGSKLGNFVFQLSCYLFEPFANFLRVHPTSNKGSQNGFSDFIDKLLEPLIHLLYVLTSSACVCQNEQRTTLSKLVAEVLAQGLFHPTHIDGFLRYKSSSDVTTREEKNKSYHRHLFDKVEKIVTKKSTSALAGLGELLHLFVNCVTKHKGVSASGGGTKQVGESSTIHIRNNPSGSSTIIPEKNPGLHSMDAELRKDVFDYFVQIMKYILADVNNYLQFNGDVGSVLTTLRSMNNLLVTLIHDKLYLRTEDTTEGVCRNFLQDIYKMVKDVSYKIPHPSTSLGSDKNFHQEILISVWKELIIAVHHLLNIEYEVVGCDMERLWFMVFSSLACCHISAGVVGQSLLSSEIMSLACRLIDLYSELRQVDSSIFALCREARNSILLLLGSEECTRSQSCSSYSNSLSMFRSLKFRVTLSNAIKSIPEGQAAGFISQLTSEIVESLEWMKSGDHLAGVGENSSSIPYSYASLEVSLRAELLGEVLCEVYTIILESLKVSSSDKVGEMLKKLIETLRPRLSSLVAQWPHSVEDISIVVDGRTLSKSTGYDNISICWILTFFFRLISCCKSLIRQVISLVHRNALKKELSQVIGDSFINHSGSDWLEMDGSDDKGFFSWILQPSQPLLDVLHFISDINIEDSVVLCKPLAYVSNVMTLQRLSDLNKLIMSSEYMLRWNQSRTRCNQTQRNMLRWNQTARSVLWRKQTRNRKIFKDDGDLSSYHKRIKQWKRSISGLRREAAGLTNFMLRFLLSMAKGHVTSPLFDAEYDDTLIQGLHSNDTLNFEVDSRDEKSLSSALWRIICQNIDIWCTHAAKENLKNFFTVLVQSSLSCASDDDGNLRMFDISKPCHLHKVTDQIAMKFLSNTVSYEQKFVRRYMLSRFCGILQNSMLPIFSASGVDLISSPDSPDVASTIQNLFDVQSVAVPQTKPNMVPAECSSKQINDVFPTCQRLLTLCGRMSEECLTSKLSSLNITYILNLERLLVGSLLHEHSASYPHNLYQIFQLFVSCRRFLKTLVASCKENMNGCAPPSQSEHPEFKVPLPWLLKSMSVVIGFQHAFAEENALEAKSAIFSLMDYTSNVVLTVSKDLCECAIRFLNPGRKLRGERNSLFPGTQESPLPEGKLQVNPLENLDAWQSVKQLAEILDEHLQNSLTAYRDAPLGKKVECLAGTQKLNKLSSVLSCFHGLLCGLSSALSDTNAANYKFKAQFSSDKPDRVTRIDAYTSTFLSFMTFSLKALFLEDDPLQDASANSGHALGARDFSSVCCNGSGDTSEEGEIRPAGEIEPSYIKRNLINCNSKRNMGLQMQDLVTLLSEAQNHRRHLKKSLLLQVFQGENAEAAFFLRQLFIACSALLRLNLQITLTSMSWNSFPILIDIIQFLLLEFSRSRMPHQFAFVWLDGIVRFLEELGSYFPQVDPSLSRDFYVIMISLHLRVIGKCISLQGKEAKLASRETEPHAKMLGNQVESCFSQGTSRLGECQATWRMSFRTFVKKSSELHLLSAIQAVERALVGVHQGQITNYKVFCGGLDGGEVSSEVAAGIDCLDLILEFVTGDRRFNMIRRNIQGFVASLFNVILHLQACGIFYEYVYSTKADLNPDSGSVILMCIEVLNKIFGKPFMFQIDGCHIAQCLRVPGALFQYFLQLQRGDSSGTAASVISTSRSIDGKFVVELYAASCRLLSTSIKHQSETRQCIALLEDSVSVLLNCLELVKIDGVSGKECFALEVHEAVKCASSLRRVYEEVRQQKLVFGQYSFQFLSRYIWLYCGCGPARNGIMREIDEALRPGVYALMDCCSADDLQLLHTSFGEGPCRSTLAALQKDYHRNFKFEGKV